MSKNVPDWVREALAEGHRQKISHGKLIPGRERAHPTLREQAFQQSLEAKEKAPSTAETVVFDALDKLNKTVGRQ